MTEIPEINISTERWVEQTGVKYTTHRLDEYHKIKNSLQLPLCFTTNNYFTVETRIGSPSVNAEVYLLRTPNGSRLAGKILPITSDKSTENNRNEIKISTIASDLVKQGKTIHFPLVYGSEHCISTIYNKNSPHFESSYVYWLKTQVSKTLGKREAIIFDKKSHNMTREEMKEYVREKIPDTLPIDLPSDVLLSEVASTDLDLLLFKTKGCNQNLKALYLVILDCVSDMQKLY